MLVRLKPDAAVGYINDQLSIVTNDGYRQTIPLPIEGRVRSALSVSPTPMVLGIVQVGDVVEKKLLVRAKSDFRVTGVTCQGADIAFQVDTEKAAKVHFIPLTFTATEAGKIECTIHIETDLPGNASAELVASGEVKATEAVSTQ
jgi:hypothetical protein